jgi:hypothetical protein
MTYIESSQNGLEKWGKYVILNCFFILGIVEALDRKLRKFDLLELFTASPLRIRHR